MKIYLVRHGQCNSNVNKVFNYLEEDLNETGVLQAESLKEKIKDLDYDIVFCSPLLRARHTAEIINVSGKEVIIDDRLREREPGNLMGKPLNFTDREEYWNYYTKTVYGTEELIPALFERVNEFLEELKKKKYSNVLIVAHSGVSKAFYAYFNGIPQDGKFLNVGLKNCEVKEYVLKKDEE